MKRRMELDLRGHCPHVARGLDPFLRVTDATAQALGELMLDAYRETVDDGGECLEEAVAEVSRVFSGGYGPLLAEYSACMGPLQQPNAALFVVEETEGELFIPYVVTAKRAVRRGYASALLQRCIRLAKVTGKSKVFLYVTETNQPALALYQKLGFTEVYLPLPVL